jgi:hypothetical protein
VAALKAAITAANMTPTTPSTIDLAPACRYTLTDVDNDVNGLPVVQSPITINGNGSTIARGSVAGTPAFRIWQVGADGRLALNLLTITGGDAPNGGGIYNNGGMLTLDTSAITGNTATSGGDTAGGGIYNTGTVTLVNSELDHNLVSSTDGVAEGGGLENAGTAVLQISRVHDNKTSSSGDSAIASGVDNEFGATLTLNASQVYGNSAISPSFAGGSAISSAGVVTLNDSKVYNNATSSAGTAGAALYHVGPRLTLNDSQVYGNTATSPGVAGGGIYTGGDFELNRSRVFDNTVSNTSADFSAGGAGIFVVGGEARLTDSTVTRNRAIGPNAQGGGIAKLGVASVTLVRSFVTGNVPDNCYPSGSIDGCNGDVGVGQDGVEGGGELAGLAMDEDCELLGSVAEVGERIAG